MSNERAISVSIKYLPYPEEKDGKNLEAGKFLFPNFTRLFEVSSKLIGKNKDGTDRVRYFTGLEPEDYKTEAEKEEIVKVKAELEKYFGEGSLEPYNVVFWREKSLLINRETTHLNLDKPEDRLTYYLIKGGGFQEIASSFEMANDRATAKRWYMIDALEYAEMDVTDDRQINKAIRFLEELDEKKSFDDMFVIHKVLVTSERGITRQSPKSTIYKDLNEFIHGRIVRSNKKQTAKQFLDAVEQLKKDKKAVYIAAYLKEGSYFNFLTEAEDRNILNVQTRTKYGTSVEKAAAYLSNPVNQSELENLKERVEAKWDNK